MAIEPVTLCAWPETRMIYLELTNGRIVGFPADRFHLLSQASAEQLQDLRLEVDGSNNIGFTPKKGTILIYTMETF